MTSSLDAKNPKTSQLSLLDPMASNTIQPFGDVSIFTQALGSHLLAGNSLPRNHSDEAATAENTWVNAVSAAAESRPMTLVFAGQLPSSSAGLAIPDYVLDALPIIVVQAGPYASKRFVEFFLVNIHNANTRAAYARAINEFLLWCEVRNLRLEQIEPIVVAAYIQSHSSAPPTIKQHLAAIKMMFDYLVTGRVLPSNPAAAVRGPKYVVKKGKTPVLSAQQARQLLDSIDVSHVVGLRDRALIGLMTYSFARVSAAINTQVGDYCGQGRRTRIRLHEKGGRFHEVPLHHNADEYLHTYIEAAGIGDDRKGPLFRTARGRTKTLTQTRMQRTEVYLMIKRRAHDGGLPEEICCHTFRATGITAYLENGGTIEKAQQIAAHESPRTTKLYDRTNDTISLDEVERILI